MTYRKPDKCPSRRKKRLVSIWRSTKATSCHLTFVFRTHPNHNSPPSPPWKSTSPPPSINSEGGQQSSPTRFPMHRPLSKKNRAHIVESSDSRRDVAGVSWTAKARVPLDERRSSCHDHRNIQSRPCSTFLKRCNPSTESGARGSRRCGWAKEQTNSPVSATSVREICWTETREIDIYISYTVREKRSGKELIPERISSSLWGQIHLSAARRAQEPSRDFQQPDPDRVLIIRHNQLDSAGACLHGYHKMDKAVGTAAIPCAGKFKLEVHMYRFDCPE